MKNNKKHCGAKTKPHTDIPYVCLRKAMAQASKNRFTSDEEKQALCNIMYGLKYGESNFNISNAPCLLGTLKLNGFIITEGRIKVI